MSECMRSLDEGEPPKRALANEVLGPGPDGVCVIELNVEESGAADTWRQTATRTVLALIDHAAGATVLRALRSRQSVVPGGGETVLPVRVSAKITAFPERQDRLVARSEVISHTPTMLIIETTVTGAGDRRLARGWYTTSLAPTGQLDDPSPARQALPVAQDPDEKPG
jgi:hypothetical protein